MTERGAAGFNSWVPSTVSGDETTEPRNQMATPYLPASDANFSIWLGNFSTKLTAAPALYGLIAGDATAVAGVTTTFNAAYLAATTPATRTPVTVAAKDAARSAAEAMVRPYASRISVNPAVTDPNKIAIGVTVRNTTPTPIPPPTTAPTLDLASAISGVQTLNFKEPGAVGKSKPYGVIGVQLFASVGTVFATDPDQATYIGVVTKSPSVQTFAPADIGKKVTWFARWVTRSGPGGQAQTGPWSDPLNLIIM